MISQKIISWYNKNKRDLPFRNTKDAYKIWLSEVILQQTRVEQGLPYYYRFIEQFPDVFSLAKAKEEQVLKLWQGLGYYTRGRNLHHTAKIIAEKYNGRFPAEQKLLLELKGVGEYTASAIASFAFDLPHAAVDGNVMRVLSRLFKITDSINSPKGKTVFKKTAYEVLNKKNPALHNHAIMELGALVCRPQNPKCNECPVAENCFAFKLKKQNQLPVKETSQKVRNRYFYYLVIEYKSKLLLRKRITNDIWKNLYDFPLVETSTKKTNAQILSGNDAKKILSQNKFVVENVSNEFKHQLSHQTIYATFIHLKANRNFSYQHDKAIFVSKVQMKNQFALPRLIERYIESGF